MNEEERLILEHEGRAAFSEMGEFVPDFDDAISQAEIDEPPAHRPAVSITVDGEWQGFPSIAAAEQAAYADFKAASHRDAQNFHITDDALGIGGAKAKFRANMAAINLLKELEFEGLQASPEQQEILSRYVGWGGLQMPSMKTSQIGQTSLQSFTPHFPRRNTPLPERPR